MIQVIFCIIVFVIFFNRAGQIGETRRAFWGFSGLAVVIAPSLVVGFLLGIIESFFDYLPEWAGFLNTLLGVLCLIGGGLAAKWMLDRFLPLPSQLLEPQDGVIPKDD